MRWAVWGTWAGMSGALLVLVWQYGVNVPYSDDVSMLPYLAGAQPITVKWLWAMASEHRIPIPKLIAVGIASATDVDLRAVMWLHVALLSGSSALLLRQVERHLGPLTLADAVLPVLALWFAHSENVLWAFALQFVLSTALLLCALAAIVSNRPSVVTLLACTIALCGSQGLPYAAALGGYLALRRHPGSVAVAALLVLYLLGYEKPAYHPEIASMSTSAAFGVHILGNGWSMGLWPLTGAIAGVAYLWAGGVALRRGQPGILAVIAAGVLVSVAIGFGRAGFGPQQAEHLRYTLLTAPALAAVYLAVRPLEVPRALLSASVVAMLGLNTVLGLDFARSFSTVLRRAEADYATLPLEEFCTRQTPHIYYDSSYLCAAMRTLAAKRGQMGR